MSSRSWWINPPAASLPCRAVSLRGVLDSVSQRVCSRMEPELPTAPPVPPCTLSGLSSLPIKTHHSHAMPHPHPWRPLSKLPTPPSVCLGLLWGESKTGELVDFTNSYIFKDIFILPLPWRASWLGIEFLFHHGTIISNYCY